MCLISLFFLRSGKSWSLRCRDASLVGGVFGDDFVILVFIDYIYGTIGTIIYWILLLEEMCLYVSFFTRIDVIIGNCRFRRRWSLTSFVCVINYSCVS